MKCIYRFLCALAVVATTLYFVSCEHLPETKPWDKCKLSSCWDGNNAEVRFMNMLSPHFSEGKFNDYLSWQMKRGCDHIHLFLLNEHNGEGSGYDCCLDPNTNALAAKRLRKIRSHGFGIVLWLVSDDSNTYRKNLAADPDKYIIAAANLLNYASAVVIGLEMNEGNMSFAQWGKIRSSLRAHFSGPIGVHHTDGNSFPYAALGDFVCGQLAPGCTEAQIVDQIHRIQSLGKTAVGFEYARHPDRERSNIALKAGAHSCGNW